MNSKKNGTKMTRRKMLGTSAAALAGSALLGGGQQVRARSVPSANRTIPPGQTDPLPPAQPGRDYQPVVTTNNTSLPWKIVDGVKVYHLVAEEVEHEFAPGLKAFCWGYNGHVHGPTIEAVEGDRVRIFVTNKLDAPTTVHWHAILVPSGMDGVGGLSQRAIYPGETFKYEFTLQAHGTYMYHSHHDEMTQIGMGMTGLFIVHPRNPRRPPPDRDYAILLHEWDIEPGTYRPDPFEMTDFNVLTMNARAFPGTEPLTAEAGERVRIRLGNLSPMSHHPIHLHGHHFRITATDGGPIPESAQWPETTVLVGVGQSRDIEFEANPGDWAIHCHMTHHVMNQMGHDIPNVIGVDTAGLDRQVRSLLPAYMTMGRHGMGNMAEMGMPVPENSTPMVGAPGPYDYITMGGMFTILKVRERLTGSPGWYDTPPGTLATAAELRRNDIEASTPSVMQDEGMGGHGGH